MAVVSDEVFGGRVVRTLGWAGLIDRVLMTSLPLIAIAFILNVPQYLNLRVWAEQYLALFLGFILVSIFLSRPASPNAPQDKVPWYDVVLAIASAATSGFVVIAWEQIVTEGSLITPGRVVLAIAAIVTIMEGTRRLFGWTLVILVGLFIFYGLFTELFPGPFYGKGIPWQRLAVLLYLDKNGLLGVTLDVVAIMVLPFVLMGQFLIATGGGVFLTDTALSMFGRMRGGPAKVPVVASAFFGMLSGVAVANVYTTGQITIPMMKRYGIEPHVAGAIEATAATGGVIMPPVMGVVAFMIAVFLNTSYANVCIAAAIPAILYYYGVYIQVDRYTASRGFGPLPPEEVPSLLRTLQRNWHFFIPLGGLFYFLFGTALSVERAAIYASLCVPLVTLFPGRKRLSLRDFGDVLETTGRGISEVGVICALAGFLIGVVMFTGLGFALTRALVDLSGGQLLPLLAMTAVICTILGMGMPVVTVYVIAVTLIVPALSKVGVQDIAAHMFVFYYSMMSFLTPPVMLSVFAAASVAGSGLWATAWPAMRFAIAGYLVPFAFVYNPALLFYGSYGEIVQGVVTTSIAVSVIAIGLEGHIKAKLHPVSRGLLIAGGVVMFWPFSTVWVIAACGAALVIVFELLRPKHREEDAHKLVW